MDNRETIDIANKYAKLVKNTLACKRVVLFGSHANNNANIDSDIDIAVVFKLRIMISQ